jgi:hypothetical protein
MKIRNSLASTLLAGVALSLCAMSALAQQPANPSTPSVLPRRDFHFPGNVGRTYADSDPGQFPQPVKAPKGAPNVILILIDDVGFGQFSTFGGGVPSPTMDKLAAEGLRYNSFHTNALCSPTRAALITGRNHHSAASCMIGEAATGYDGYTTILPRSTGTVGEVLRQNGYMTAWIGKNHNTPVWEASAVGPFDRWANGLGFDYFYGFNGGDMNHWNPVLYENRNLVPASADPNYYLTTDLADHAIAWVRKVKTIAPDRPYLRRTLRNHSPPMKIAPIIPIRYRALPRVPAPDCLPSDAPVVPRFAARSLPAVPGPPAQPVPQGRAMKASQAMTPLGA